MNKTFSLLFVSFLVSLPFWVGLNLLGSKTNFLFSAQIPNLKAQINQESATTTVSCFFDDITAESFLILKVDNRNEKTVLAQRKSSQQLPMASITKLMTYLVANEFYKNEQAITITPDIVQQANTLNALLPGDTLKVKELIPIMLIESSNDAAFALTKVIGEEGFLDLMNLKANELGLENTYFYNPTGVDPEARNMPQDQINYSTAIDIANLTLYLLSSNTEFLNIVSQKEYPLYKDGKKVSVMKNTNELIGEIPEIIGGKTGTTDRAGECLMVIFKPKDKQEHIIGVVLNSKQRFVDMKKLLSCSF